MVIFALVLWLNACAAAARRGSVAMKLDEQTVHVSLGSGDVSPGRRVVFYRQECRRHPVSEKPITIPCRLVKSGSGTVDHVFNRDYSSVKIDSGAAVREGDLVEAAG